MKKRMDLSHLTIYIFIYLVIIGISGALDCTAPDGEISSGIGKICEDEKGTYTFHRCLSVYSIGYTFCDEQGSCIELGNRCDSGFCQDGQCLEPYGCEEADEEDMPWNPDVAGQLSFSYDVGGETITESWSDTCKKETAPGGRFDKMLTEVYCDDQNKPAMRGFDCEYGCNEGRCSGKDLPNCTTLGTEMYMAEDGTGYIGCDVKVSGAFDLSKSYCEGEDGKSRETLRPDKYDRDGQYYATLKGLRLDEGVNVFIYSRDGERVRCIPKLNIIGDCIDTDLGRDYFRPGTTRAYNMYHEYIIETDYCLDEILGVETYCDEEGFFKRENFNCDFGCSDGSCLNELPGPAADESVKRHVMEDVKKSIWELIIADFIIDVVKIWTFFTR